MAWDFGAEIHALSGFNADDGTNLTETGELYTLHANQWLTEGAKEIINLLPPKLKEKCAAVTHLYIGNTNVTMDMDSADEILYLLASIVELIDLIWGDNVIISDRSIDVHIRNFRSKIGKQHGDMIKTISGKGYGIIEICT